MIDALKALVEQAEKLPPERQAALAEKWRRELEELAWDQAFYAPGSLEMLLKRREEVLAEDDAGETEEIGEDGFFYPAVRISMKTRSPSGARIVCLPTRWKPARS